VVRREDRMNQKIFVLALGAMLLALCSFANAQQQKKIPRIGYLGLDLTIDSRLDAFRDGLRQLGHAEGKDIVIDSRTADRKLHRLNELATELVRLKVDVIVTRGPAPTRAAKASTATIPIVMTQDPDPVGNGFVASLARPGENITGLASLSPETSAKQLELLKETVPKLSRVAVLSSSTVPGHALQLREIGLMAGPLTVQLQSLDVLGPKDLDTAFQAASNQRAEAFIVLGAPSSLLSEHAFWSMWLRIGSQQFTRGNHMWRLVVS
jgi:putative ABC transport system substrate-binding protein